MRHSFGVGVVDCLVRGILSEKRNQGDDGEEKSLRILPCPSSENGIFPKRTSAARSPEGRNWSMLIKFENYGNKVL